MAVLRAVKNKKQTKGSMLGVMIYMADATKTTYENYKLTTGVNCNFYNSYKEMMLTKEQYKKTDKRQFYQFVQSFSEDDVVTPLEVHQMGLELAQELFPQFEVIVTTHTNTENLHNHILVNSVSFETGKKLHQNHDTFVWQRQKNDEICIRYGLATLDKYEKMKRGKAISSAEYNAAKRGKSWKFRLMATIDECMKYAQNKDMFLELMESEGYSIHWSETRKYITYTTLEGNKCRDNKLHENKYRKEHMENEFRIRDEIVIKRTETIKPTTNVTRDETVKPTTSVTRDTTIKSTTTVTSDTAIKSTAAVAGGTAKLQRGNISSDGLYNREFEVPEQGYENDFSVATADARADEIDVKPIFVGGTEQETGEDLRPIDTDEQEPITGWEEERERLFNPQIQTANDSNSQSGNVFDTVGIVDIASDLLQFGVSLESLENTEPVIDATTQPTQKVSKKRRTGQQKDDQRYNFEIKM